MKVCVCVCVIEREKEKKHSHTHTKKESRDERDNDRSKEGKEKKREREGCEKEIERNSEVHQVLLFSNECILMSNKVYDALIVILPEFISLAGFSLISYVPQLL